MLRKFFLVVTLIFTGIHVEPLMPAQSLSYAQEQRCTDLGASCSCSEPLNTNTYTETVTAYFKAGDSPATNFCTNDGQRAVVVRNGTAGVDFMGSNSGQEITNLPAGHTNTYVLRGPEGHLGTFYLGATHMLPTTAQRFAARWYFYYSTNFQFVGEGGGACENNKISEAFGTGASGAPDQAVTTNPGGDFHTYNYLDWTPSTDCCSGGPGPDSAGVGIAAMKGKWWRYEMIIQRPNGQGNTTPGAGPVTHFYIKNVTDNGAELHVIDTSLAPLQSQNRNPPAPYDSLVSNIYRQGVCNGYNAAAYYMTAYWNVDSGQRIGAATEIEPSGPDTTPPDTTIVTHPTDPTTSTDASFTFTSTETGSIFECKMDAGPFASCTSPKSYAGLSAGGASHTFQVRATDAALNTDASPATFTWTVNTAGGGDTTPPPAPGTPALTLTSTDAKGVSYSITWSASIDEPSKTAVPTYNWAGGYNDGQAATSGTVSTNSYQYSIPYHTSITVQSGYFCVTAVDAASNQSIDASCGVFTVNPADQLAPSGLKISGAARILSGKIISP
jgi:hypothetical protein